MFNIKVLGVAIFVCKCHRRDSMSEMIAEPPCEVRWAAEPDGTQSGLSFTSRPLSVPHTSIKPVTKSKLPPEVLSRSLD